MVERVQALNYRCLRYVDVRLRPFQVLVGPNASGKSTFLDVIAFLGDLIRDGTEAAVVKRAPRLRDLLWNQTGTSLELAVELRVPDELRKTLPNGYGLCRYEVGVGEDESGQIVVTGETFWLRPSSEPAAATCQRPLFPSEPSAPPSIVSPAGTWASAGWRRVVSKVPSSGNDRFRSETSKWTSVFRLGPKSAALANLPEDETRFPVAVWAKRTLMEGVQSLALSSRAMRNPSPRWRGTSFRPDGSNLPAVIQTLRDRDPQSLEAWVRHLQTALPDLQDVVIEDWPADHLCLMLVYTTGLRVPSWLVSDGTLRMMALTLLAYVPGPGPVYLVEEPENGIHPRAVETVYQSLSSVYDAQVLVATHSPILVGLASPDDMLCFGRAPSGATDIVPGRQHPALREWSGAVNLSELYAAGVLG